MRRALRLAVIATSTLLGVACRDSGPVEPPGLVDAQAAATACSATIPGLIDQAKVLFGPNAPNYNSVRGRLENMAKLLSHRNVQQRAQGRERAHDIVNFTLTLRDQGRLSGTAAQVAAFVNGVYCFAGIDIVIDTPEDTWFILPSDLPQVLVGLDSTVGVSLPANPVAEPSLLRIERFDGRLNTKLDQYPGFVRITLLNAGGTALTARATVTVCAEELPTSVELSDLRLGHGIRDTGFVVTPLPTASDPAPATLTCDPMPSGGLARAWAAFRDAFAPRILHAARLQETRRGGGVSGSVTEFSPFAPVDTRLRAGGGVSGSVTEFVRMPELALLLDEPASPIADCDTRPVGNPLPAACYPVVSIRTRLGTVLEGVPVEWDIPSESPGTIAPRTGPIDALTCGAFGRAAATTTSVNGNAGICWSLGGTGLNRVIATPRAGGDAPLGVTFDNEGAATVGFAVQVTDATLLRVQGDGQKALAGSTTGVAPKVRVVSPAGVPLAGVVVDWSVVSGAGAVTPMTGVSDADGYVQASWALGAGTNTLAAIIRFAPASKVQFGATGLVPSGVPTTIEIVEGTDITAPAGAAVSPAPQVIVRDETGAPVPGVVVTWSVLAGQGSVSAESTTTSADGRATVRWTYGTVGYQQLKAYVQTETVFIFTYFEGMASAP